MLNKKVEEALNEQLNAEFFSAYLYLAMTAYFESQNLLGFANWMRIQAREELNHALKFYDHVNDRSGRVVLKAVGAPSKDWKSPLAAFQSAYDHEAHITKMINDLMNLAIKDGDHATQIFLQWFVTEQVEELASARAVIEKLKLVQDAPNGIFLIDHELAGRTPEAAAN